MTAVDVADFREAAAALRRQNSPACHRVADSLLRYADVDVDTLDDAFGLRRQPGQRTRSTVAAHVERDRLVIEAVAEHYPNELRERAAEFLANDLARYHDTDAWRLRERELDECPQQRVGRVYEFCWRILKAKDLPIGAPRIKQILADHDNEIPAFHYRDGGGCSGHNTEKKP